MQNITFAKRFRDRVSNLTTVVYPAGYSGRVADVVAEAARKAGALEE